MKNSAIALVAMSFGIAAFAGDVADSKVRIEYKKPKTSVFDFTDFDYSSENPDDQGKISDFLSQNECHKKRADSLKKTPIPGYLGCSGIQPVWVYTVHAGDTADVETKVSVLCDYKKQGYKTNRVIDELYYYEIAQLLKPAGQKCSLTLAYKAFEKKRDQNIANMFKQTQRKKESDRKTFVDTDTQRKELPTEVDRVPAGILKTEQVREAK